MKSGSLIDISQSTNPFDAPALEEAVHVDIILEKLNSLKLQTAELDSFETDFNKLSPLFKDKLEQNRWEITGQEKLLKES